MWTYTDIEPFAEPLELEPGYQNDSDGELVPEETIIDTDSSVAGTGLDDDLYAEHDALDEDYEVEEEDIEVERRDADIYEVRHLLSLS